MPRPTPRRNKVNLVIFFGIIFIISVILSELFPDAFGSSSPPSSPTKKYDPLDGLSENERWHVENFWPPSDVSIEDAEQAMWDGDDETWLGV